MADSICWHCARAGNCKKPVDGWNADYNPIYGNAKGEPRIPSWLVYSCPNYHADNRASEYGKPKVLVQKRKRPPKQPKAKVSSTVKCLEDIYTKEVHRFKWWKDVADFIGIPGKHLSERRKRGAGVVDRFRMWEEPVDG